MFLPLFIACYPRVEQTGQEQKKERDYKWNDVHLHALSSSTVFFSVRSKRHNVDFTSFMLMRLRNAILNEYFVIDSQ